MRACSAQRLNDARWIHAFAGMPNQGRFPVIPRTMSNPMTDCLSPFQAAVRAALARHADVPGALLPILHDIQGALGFVPPVAVPEIAAALDLSRAEVHGVLGYYSDLRTTAPAPHRLRVCRAEACQAMGGQDLLDHARQRLRCDGAGRSADGAVDVQAVYCLGLCACSPALALDGELHARMDAARMNALVDALRDARSGALTDARPAAEAAP